MTIIPVYCARFLTTEEARREEEGTGGGVYLFEDDASALAYADEQTARLEGFGITDIRAKLFHVNEPLTAINGGPV
jgi:hypothetical protein